MKQDFLYWEYAGVLSEAIINDFLNNSKEIPTVEGQIGSKETNKDFRQVTTQRIGEFDNFNLLLYAYGLKANTKCWNYDITGAKQCELLTYSPNGDKYDGHVDTLRLGDNIVRKLTVVAFLNDDYEGGKFFFQTDSKNKQYLKTIKGTVVVFPSHIIHGVEPVTTGVRKSCVTWLHGPDFK